MSLPKEYEWWASHSSDMDDKYRGEYIAIVGEEVVAHGKNLATVLEEAEKGGRKPWIHKVPSSNRAMII